MVENDCVNCSSYKDRGPNIASFEVFFFFFYEWVAVPWLLS